MKRLLTACLIVLILFLAINIRGQNIAQRQIINTATIKAIGVDIYWDNECTEEVTNIDWGIVEPNSTTYKMVYMRSKGNVDVILYLSTGNWTPPEVENFVTLDWDYTGDLIAPDEVVAVNFILRVGDVTDIKSFSFSITVTAVG